MTTIDVLFTKYDGRPHRRSTAELLGDDEYGTWLGSPAGTIVEYLSSGAAAPNKVPQVRLIAPGAWWTAIFFGGDFEPLLYCDITTPAVWPATDRVTFVDLDLDVEQFRTGEVTLVDEDEFAEHQTTYVYSTETITEATAAAAHLMKAVTEGHEPFATTWRHWLTRL